MSPTTAVKTLRLSSAAPTRRINPAVEAIKAMAPDDFRKEILNRRALSTQEREQGQRETARTRAAARAARLRSLAL